MTRESATHGARTREVVGILARQGIDSVRQPTAVELRLALEELGPTFIKLGQLLSTRPDLLPPPYIRELSLLLSSVPPVPGTEIVTILEEELGSDITEIFGSFDLDALASASIGQAHAATLPDGTPVVVKVRKPGAVETIRQDLEIPQVAVGKLGPGQTSYLPIGSMTTRPGAIRS
ncbi:hypothetical protein AX769_21475 (plasmid) [Frondihabitans sp. PAMC 28766]|uniref:AarF/UbiB family protein n=1 Tax=Frondihabitans sp. PAMC 28766 TaxID=1795630 RepID=UPI00078C5C55|nr:hypothetical protein AX769_21475 [Frondihabitans sp. PAMC 28766]